MTIDTATESIDPIEAAHEVMKGSINVEMLFVVSTLPTGQLAGFEVYESGVHRIW